MRLLAFAAAALAAALLCAPATAARPYGVADLLATEGVGRIVFDPTGRWMVIERRRPYRTAARFDYNQQTGMLLTELLKVDLSDAAGRGTPLMPQDLAAGVLAGPISPDGRRMLVQRLHDHSFDLGIVEIATGAVRWLPLTPELANHGATAVWRGPHEVLAIVRAPGDLPRQLALGWEAQARLQLLWAKTREGQDPSVTAIGSGRFLDVRPREAPARLVRIDVRSGAVAELARGEFQDIALSASGRWAALIENGADLQPQAQEAIYTAFPARRRHLRLVDVTSGETWEPCPDCDVTFGLLDWAKASARLVITARAAGPDGDGKALVVIDAPRRSVTRPPLGDLVLDLQTTRNEQARRARATWLGEDLLVFAHDRTGRSDWYRLRAGGAQALTRSMPQTPRQVAAARAGRIDLVAGGALWEISTSGAVRRRVRRDGDRPLPLSQDPHARAAANPVAPTDLVLSGPRGLVRERPGHDAALPLPPGCANPIRGPEHVAAVCAGPGGRREVLVGDWTRGWRSVLTLNAGLAEIEPAVLRRVAPKGARAPSWLYLPRTPPPARGYPLVVIPYRGAVYPEPDPRFEVGAFTAYLNPQILAAQGYAVLTPSLTYDETQGEPAAGLAADILQVVDAALAAQPLDGQRIALWGQSLGA